MKITFQSSLAVVLFDAFIIFKIYTYKSLVGVKSPTTAMKRKDAIVASIANGCDIILFNKSLDEDIAYVKAGIVDGT